MPGDLPRLPFDLTNGARHHFTGNHILGRGDSTGMQFLRINNTTAFDSQMSADIVGNAADGMTGGFVTLAGQTANAMVIGNFCNTCSPLGTGQRRGHAARDGCCERALLFGAFGIDGSDGSTGIGRPNAAGTPHIDFHISGNLAVIARTTEVFGQISLANCPSSPAELCSGTVVNRVP